MDIQSLVEAKRSPNIASFRPGDRVKVYSKVVEGDRERIQAFEGEVIRVRGGGLNSNFTVRRISHGVGVERTFPFYSPLLDKVEVTRWGRVRRAKLYYLRDRIGKAARIKASSRARLQSAAQAAAFAATAAAAKAESELVLGEEEPVEDIEAIIEEEATAEVATEVTEETEAPAAEPGASAEIEVEAPVEEVPAAEEPEPAEVEAPEAAADEPADEPAAEKEPAATEEEEQAEKA